MTDFTDSSLVTPGQFITSEKSFLRGHGSFIFDNSEGYQLLSCVAGQIERIDKLITVKPVKSR
jgi:exosome complex component RRP4